MDEGKWVGRQLKRRFFLVEAGALKPECGAVQKFCSVWLKPNGRGVGGDRMVSMQGRS